MQAFDHLPIYDSGTAPEIFAYGIAKAEVVGPMLRMFVFVPQDVGGVRCRNIVAILTIPTETIAGSRLVADQAMVEALAPVESGIRMAS